MNNDDIMALYNSKPFGQAPPQQNIQPTQQMQSSQFYMPNSGFAQPNVMSMSQPAGFNQFPVQNWANDGFSSMAPTQPAAQTPAFSSPPAHQKPAASAFDDLFATATAHFSTATPANNTTQNNFKVQTPATTTAAHQDLESLFM